MDTFGRLPSSEIVTEHEVGEGGKKLTFRKHLKSSQVPYDPERKTSALNFVKFVVEDLVGQATKPKSTLVQAFKPEIWRKLIWRLSHPPSLALQVGTMENLMMDSRAILKSIEQSNFNSKLMIG